MESFLYAVIKIIMPFFVKLCERSNEKACFSTQKTFENIVKIQNDIAYGNVLLKSDHKWLELIILLPQTKATFEKNIID